MTTKTTERRRWGSDGSRKVMIAWLVGWLSMLTVSWAAGIDSDGNGLSDVWEAVYGAGLVADGDEDGDGFTNREEAMAGTDPRDGRSHSRLMMVGMGQGELVVAWPSVAGVGYGIEVSGDLLGWHAVGQSVVGTGATMELRLPLAKTVLGAGARRSVWHGLTDWGLNDLKAAAAGARVADLEDTLAQLETPASNPDIDHFGQWIRGTLVAPQAGEYRFAIASDDRSELWLSDSADPSGVRLVASVGQWTHFREWDKYPQQLSAPILLEAWIPYHFEIFHRDYSRGDHLSVGWVPPGGDPLAPEILGAPHLSLTGRTLADELATQGHLYARMAVDAVDSDGDGVNDYEERLLGLDPQSPTTRPGKPDRLQAQEILASPSVLSVSVQTARGYEAEGQAAQFLISRAGGIGPLVVEFELAGSATAGIDYAVSTEQIVFAPGQRAAVLDIMPHADELVEEQESVALSLRAGERYEVGNPFSATVWLDDSVDVLFVAQLRPDAAYPSGGYGTAAVRRKGNALSAVVSLSFGGLAGPQQSAHIYLSDNGVTGPAVLALPPGQVGKLDWEFAQAGGLSREEIIAALDKQRLWVRVSTDAAPDGEIRGRLSLAPGWANMPAVAAAPPAPAFAAHPGEAARFLAQASFGANAASLAELGTGHFADWIEQQLQLPPTLHLPYVLSRRAELQARNGNDGYHLPRQEAWWQHALTAPDQLRQRMAFALSQILVISQDGALSDANVGATRYYDLLLEHAFGNYRDLLEAVTLSPMMGVYLSMMRNRKPDPVTGYQPDENYAREIMQLFSIGLNRLHMDGSLQLDSDGLPLPTYTQDDIVELAHIFTGWGPHYDPANPPTWGNGQTANPDSWFIYGKDENRPMTLYPQFHDSQDRVIIGDTRIPGNLDPKQRLRMALDTLFQHPNVPPFIARQLIQKFVTSNPSPGYVFRVASAFADNGLGVRGDLGATLRAVLLDYEARHPQVRQWYGYGKSAEPLLRLARLLRAVAPIPPLAAYGEQRLFLNLLWSMPQQAPLFSPSVFNFFQPGYSAPGIIAAAGLLSPEFQIFSETTAIQQANIAFSTINWGIWTVERYPDDNSAIVQLDFAEMVAVMSQPGQTKQGAEAALIDFLDTRLLFGAMSPQLRADIQYGFDALPNWFDTSPERQWQRAQMATYLIVVSPEFFVQR